MLVETIVGTLVMCLGVSQIRLYKFDLGGRWLFGMAVFNWAERSKDERGRLLLERNPLKGLRKPREKNPARVVLTDDEYRAFLKVSRRR